MRNKICMVFYVLLILFVTGCASKPKIKGTADLCGFVIDENNLPVENYVISVKHGNGIWKTSITNRQGLFSFSDVPLGEYSFKGTKSCYVDLNEKKYAFYDRSKIFCFQIDSIEEALNQVEKKILCKDYESGLELLNNINCDRKTAARKVVLRYREYIKEQVKIEKERLKNEK